MCKILEIEEAGYDRIPILPWYIGIIFVGAYDKISVADGISVPIYETAHSVVLDIVKEGIKISASEHY